MFVSASSIEAASFDDTIRLPDRSENPKPYKKNECLATLCYSSRILGGSHDAQLVFAIYGGGNTNLKINPFLNSILSNISKGFILENDRPGGHIGPRAYPKVFVIRIGKKRRCKCERRIQR